jgi:hypothetical protein
MMRIIRPSQKVHIFNTRLLPRLVECHHHNLLVLDMYV